MHSCNAVGIFHLLIRDASVVTNNAQEQVQSEPRLHSDILDGQSPKLKIGTGLCKCIVPLYNRSSKVKKKTGRIRFENLSDRLISVRMESKKYMYN